MRRSFDGVYFEETNESLKVRGFVPIKHHVVCFWIKDCFTLARRTRCVDWLFEISKISSYYINYIDKTQRKSFIMLCRLSL